MTEEAFKKLASYTLELANRVRELEHDKRVRDNDNRLNDLYDHHLTVQQRLKTWKSN